MKYENGMAPLENGGELTLDFFKLKVKELKFIEKELNSRIKIIQNDLDSFGNNQIEIGILSNEPLVDKFGNTFHLKGDDRVIKHQFAGEVELDKLEIEWLKKMSIDSNGKIRKYL